MRCAPRGLGTAASALLDILSPSNRAPFVILTAHDVAIRGSSSAVRGRILLLTATADDETEPTSSRRCFVQAIFTPVVGS